MAKHSNNFATNSFNEWKPEITDPRLRSYIERIAKNEEQIKEIRRRNSALKKEMSALKKSIELEHYKAEVERLKAMLGDDVSDGETIDENDGETATETDGETIQETESETVSEASAEPVEDDGENSRGYQPYSEPSDDNSEASEPASSSPNPFNVF